MHNNISNYIVERCNEHIQLLAILVLFLPQLIQGSTISTVFDALSLYTGCIFGYIVMDIIAYATVMHTNRPGLWPSHFIYLDNYEMIYQICAVVHHYSCVPFSEGLFRSHFGLKQEDMKGPAIRKKYIYCVSNTTEHILTKFGVLPRKLFQATTRMYACVVVQNH